MSDVNQTVLPMKIYLGDSVYAEWTGFDIILTTENGLGATNTIVLEPSVRQALVLFIERVAKCSLTVR